MLLGPNYQRIKLIFLQELWHSEAYFFISQIYNRLNKMNYCFVEVLSMTSVKTCFVF